MTVEGRNRFTFIAPVILSFISLSRSVAKKSHLIELCILYHDLCDNLSLIVTCPKSPDAF